MEPKSRLEKILGSAPFEVSIGVLIIISVLLTLLEVQAAPGSQTRDVFMYCGLAITVLFIIELSLRFWVARSWRHFIREYWVDILAVLPPIRALRFLRVLRLLRLWRLGLLIARRSKRSSSMIQEGLMENILLIMVLAGVFIVGAFGMFLVEKENASFSTLSKTIWWSLFTLMAGEPIGGEATTFGGRLISAMVMLGGFTFFAVFTGVVSAVMVNRFKGRLEATDMELQALENHFIICGWNRSGVVIVTELQAGLSTKSSPIVIVAELEERPELPKTIDMGLIYFVPDDYTANKVLRRIGVTRAKAAILLADKSKPRSDQDRDARTILAALTIERLCKEADRDIFTCVELLNRENRENLKGTNIEDIVIGDDYTGNLMAHSSRAWGLVSVLDELLTATRGNQFYKVKMLPDLVGKSFAEALPIVKKKYEAILISVEEYRTKEEKRDENKRLGRSESLMRVIHTNPPSEYVLKEEDKLILIAINKPQ